MRTFDVTVRTRKSTKVTAQWEEVASFTCDANLNIRAVLIYMYQYYFGKAPKEHWAVSNHLCMGQAWNTKRITRATCEVEIYQHNRMTDAYCEARTIIWNAQQPRLAERRAA